MPLTSLFGQTQPDTLLLQMFTDYELVFDADLVSEFKERRNEEQTFFPCQLNLFSRKQGLEIRILLEPLDSNDQMTYLPDFKAGRTVTHLAGNEEDSIISVHGMSEEEAAERFHADWGRVFYFSPKAQFSSHSNCRMLTLLKEKKIMVYVFFLFDKPPDDLDESLEILRFSVER